MLSTKKSHIDLPRRHVPWMHVFEWQQVCCDVFSFHLGQRRRGYEKLLLWKARYFKLPTGIQCTIELLQADLIDKHALKSASNTGSFGEQEIRVLMASSIMRFFNLLAECRGYEDNDTTLRKMAASLSIPEWLVDVRHSQAHKTVLPSLDIVRKGIAFCLDWLLENYWQVGNDSSNLLVPLALPISKSITVILDILDAWDSLNVSIRHGSSTIDEVNSKPLKTFLKQQFSDKSTTEFTINLELKSDRDLSNILHKVQGRLLNEIHWYCSKGISDDNVETIIRIIMQSKTFIPSPDLLNNMMSPGSFYMGNAEEIMKWVVNIWKSVLIPLQERYCVFPSLICELLICQVDLGNKGSIKQHILSLWIKVLCKSMIKTKVIDKLGPPDYDGVFDTPSVPELRRRRIFQIFELQDVFDVKPSHEMGNYCKLSVIKFAVQSPNKFTPLFLHSLMKLSYPSISKHTEKLLTNLVLTYTAGGETNEDEDEEDGAKHLPSDHVHTLQELSVIDAEPACKVSDFATAEWYACPLGALPWIKEVIPSVDFPEKIKWFEKDSKGNDCLLPRQSSQLNGKKKVNGKQTGNVGKGKKSLQQKLNRKKKGKPFNGLNGTGSGLSKLQKKKKRRT